MPSQTHKYITSSWFNYHSAAMNHESSTSRTIVVLGPHRLQTLKSALEFTIWGPLIYSVYWANLILYWIKYFYDIVFSTLNIWAN